jgi:hypothetical protein
MSVSDELVWLINQLRNTQSARERLRLLALGWRTLKQLSASDRLAVAKELGFDGGAQLVEELSRRGGVSPSLLLGALRAAEATPSQDVREIVDGLLDPNRRSETVEAIAEGAADWVIDRGSGESEGEPAPAPESPPDEIDAELAEPRSTTLGAVLSSASAAAVEVGRELSDDEEVAGKSPWLRKPSADAVEAPPAIEPQQPVESELPSLPDQAEQQAEESEVVISQSEPPPASTERAELPDETGAEDDSPEPVQVGGDEPPDAQPPAPMPIPESDVGPEIVFDRIAESASLLERLRELELAAAQAGGLSLGRLDELLDSFPTGWARRRALEVLIRAGVPERLDDVLSLIDRLERRSDRMWALTTIALSRDFDSDEADKLLEEAETPTLARRLALRLGRTL